MDEFKEVKAHLNFYKGIVEKIRKEFQYLFSSSANMNKILNEAGPLPKPLKEVPAVVSPTVIFPDKTFSPRHLEAKKIQNSNSDLSKCEFTLLAVLVQREESCSKSQLSISSGYTIRSSGFNNGLSSLRVKEYISGQRDEITITASGISALGQNYPVLMQGEQLHQYWYNKISKSEAKILAELISCYPSVMSREEISEKTGYSLTSSGFNNSLSTLRVLGLAQGYKSEIKAAKELFD